VLIVSPHLDDAVFSCGQLLVAHPGSVVVTVLAGTPSSAQPLTGWDRETGFSSAPEAVRARLEEDTRACALVGAVTVRLGLLDGQYDRPPDHHARLRVELERVIAEHAPGPVFVPLGIRHPDHIEVGSIARDVATALRAEVVVYEELPYRVAEPEEQVAARARIAAEGWALEPRVEILGSIATKQAAIDCYISQEPHFAREHLVAPEQYLTATRIATRVALP
jgi:LmbE family N-acetylglucosaminyl deacetylase